MQKTMEIYSVNKAIHGYNDLIMKEILEVESGSFKKIRQW